MAIRRMPRTLALAGACLIVLAGCGGGGGGGSGSPPPPFFTPVPFTSFAAVQKRQQVDMQGISQTVSANINGSNVVTGITGSALDTSGSTLSLFYDDAATLPRPNGGLHVATPSSSLSISIPPLAAFSMGCNNTTCTAQNALVFNPIETITVGNPLGLVWNYQTLSVWQQQPTATSLVFGAISAGAATPGASIPTTGTAVLTGEVGGSYVDLSGTIYKISATMTANVDFAARTVAFSTVNTTVTPNLGTPISAAALNLSGTLTYTTGVNQFTGVVTNPNGMTGSATGRYYGPNAEEIGGIYRLPGGGVISMSGGFGGKR